VTPVLSLSELNGTNGFSIDGIAFGERAGAALATIGDINADGVDDLIIGAPGSTFDQTSQGRIYVVFGTRAARPANFQLADLDGLNGFRIDGVNGGDELGQTASGIGDVNGDGIDDFAIAAPEADPNGLSSGSVYVIFGKSTGFAAELSLSGLGTSEGFRLDGALPFDRAGYAIASAGDFNGDRLDDFIVSTPFSSFTGELTGRTYIMLGSRVSKPPVRILTDLDGSEVIKIEGEQAQNLSGISVDGIGDFNGDGFDDVVIGAQKVGSGVLISRAYVVFGRSGNETDPASPILLSDLTGLGGFKMIGEERQFGESVSAAGDVNGDGYQDVLVGSNGATGGSERSGRSYVLFGREEVISEPVQMGDLDGIDGFFIDGDGFRDKVAGSVDGIRDFDGDGLDDLIIGAEFAPVGDHRGQSHVVLGRRPPHAPTLLLGELDGVNGFTLEGEAPHDHSGTVVSGAGDFNADGLQDLVLSSLAAPRLNNRGRSYVFFGSREEIFSDGAEDLNVVLRYPRFSVREGSVGSSVEWRTGASCDCADSRFDLRIAFQNDELTFYWNGAQGAGVASGATYAILQSGDVIGEDSSFISDDSTAASQAWSASGDGYLGFRFLNEDTGRVNYGYARIDASSSAPVVRFHAYNLTGEAIQIP
jgi:hypothetical protein